MTDGALSIPGDGSIAPRQRAYVPAGEYIGLVDSVLQDWCAKQARFTAYEVTQRLRAENPGKEIVHEMVRIAVEHQAVDHNYAVVDIQDFGGSTARVWGPMTSVRPGDAVPIITVQPDPSGDDGKVVVYLLPGVPQV